MTEVSNVTNTVLTTLDIGSGIDSVKLARDLTDAVQIPAENRIQKKIDYADTSISCSQQQVLRQLLQLESPLLLMQALMNEILLGSFQLQPFFHF